MPPPRHFSEDDFSCSVCCEVFQEPVVLLCSHSFCEACLRRWWKQKQVRECPLCKRKHAKNRALLKNLALRNACEAFESLRRASDDGSSREEEEKKQQKQQRPQEAEQRQAQRPPPLCGPHGESLNLFCRDCQHTLCVVCLYSETHAGHSFRPVAEAAAVAAATATTTPTAATTAPQHHRSEECRRRQQKQQQTPWEQQQQRSKAAAVCCAVSALLVLCCVVFTWLNLDLVALIER